MAPRLRIQLAKNPDPVSRKWAARRNPSANLAEAVNAVAGELFAYRKERGTDGVRTFKLTKWTLIFAAIAAAGAGWAAISAHISIGKVQRQIEISTRQLEVNRAVAKMELRAHVSVVPGNVFNVGSNQHAEPRIIIRNTGRTPASEVKRYVGAVISKPLTAEQEEKLGRGDLEPGSPLIGPGAADPVIRKTRPVTDEIAAKIFAERLRVYVYGRIEFVDVFGEPHYWRFCHYYSGEHTPWGQKHGGPGFNNRQAKPCSGHNATERQKLP